MALVLFVTGIVLSTAFALIPPESHSVVTTFRPRRFAERSKLTVTNQVVTLKRAADLTLDNDDGGHKTTTNYLRLQNGNSSMTSVQLGSVFLAPILVGGQYFDVVVDTGSSDTWVVRSEFTCFDPYTRAELQAEDCHFAKYYAPSATVKHLTNQNFNISYADGEWLNGAMALEDIAVASISLPQQEVALVDDAAWYGDGISSGLLGLAYPLLTSAYSGSDPEADVAGASIPYSPVFTSIHERNLTSPYFSLAIQRPVNVSAYGTAIGGYLAIGGIPDIPHSRTFISTPINIVGVNTVTSESVYQYYSIDIDGWAVSGNRFVQFKRRDEAPTTEKRPVIGNGTEVVVDSGTSLIYAPNTVAAAVAAQYSPPAKYNPQVGAYIVSCAAKPPLLGVVINDKVFYVNPVDLILQQSQTLCITGVQRSEGGLSILGDVFLRNVLAVFDVGAAEMRFAAREFS